MHLGYSSTLVNPLEYLRQNVVAEAEINPPGTQVSLNNAFSSSVT